MIIDSSALVSILLLESGRRRFIRAILSAKTRRISAPNWLETSMVFDGRMTSASVDAMKSVVSRLQIEIVHFDEDMATFAREANHRFGKPRHPARLNFGDCIAYATARFYNEPLLFKGSDFSQTDIIPALI